jgi:hypothetical protein
LVGSDGSGGERKRPSNLTFHGKPGFLRDCLCLQGRLRPEAAWELGVSLGLVVEGAEAEKAQAELQAHRGQGVRLSDFVRWWGEHGALYKQAVPSELMKTPQAFPLGEAGVGRDGQTFRTQRGRMPMRAKQPRAVSDSDSD